MLRGFRSDRAGSVAVLFALLSVVIFASAAIALDLVTIWIARRNAQGAADLAAMLATAGPGAPDAVARRTLTDNGYAQDLGSAVVTTGAYTADASLRPDQRFVPAAGGRGNAVRVSFKTTVRTTFSRVVGMPSVFEVAVSSTARTADFAAFTLGSGLASLDGGVANALLGALLGTNVSLSAMDYNALAGAKVDAFQFLDALASRANLTVADYDQILAADVTLTQVLSALSASLPGGTASQAVNTVLRTLGNPASTFPVSSFVDLGDVPAQGRPSSVAGPPLNALAALTNAVAIANGANQVAVDLGPSVAGILRTKLLVAIGQRKQSSGLVQVDSPKASLRTGQARALIEATVALPAGSVKLPIYLEAAKAAATLASVSCPWSDPARRQAAVDARPGTADLAIANVPPAAIDLSRPSPSLTDSALLLNVPLLSVSGLARVTWDEPYPQRLVFSNDDITYGRVRSASSTQPIGSITSSLVSNLRFDVNGIDLGAILGVQRTLKPALELVAAPLDQVIDTTLRMLGIRIGFADVTVDATRCGRAVLVQ